MLWGRERELAAMEQVLAAARSGQGRCLVWLGEPEMGKSALLAEAAERARDMRVLSAVGAETEARSPTRPCTSCSAQRSMASTGCRPRRRPRSASP